MLIRILSAVVLLPALLAIVLLCPVWATALLFGAASMIAAYELLWRSGLVKHLRLTLYAMVMAAAVSAWSYFGCPELWGKLGIFLYVVLLFGELLLSHAKLPFASVAIALFSGVVFPWSMGALARILAGEQGRYMILMAFVLAFSADSGAYFVGKACGKHKLCPIISPNKTVEGAIGGVLSTILIVEIFGLVLQNAFGFEVNYLYGVIYGILGALASMLGDLSYSVIKRQIGIKDYGNLIPGHGGILDRFDSMSIVAPMTELLLVLIPFGVK